MYIYYKVVFRCFVISEYNERNITLHVIIYLNFINVKKLHFSFKMYVYVVFLKPLKK